MERNKKKLHYCWIVLLGICVIRSLSAAGINNTGGLFLKPVSEELGVGIGSLSIYFSISSIATIFFMPVAGKLIQKFNIKKLILGAIVLQALSFSALGFMNKVWMWYILSIPMGIGGAIIVNLVGPILINRWFKKNTGTALGILMACVGIFGAVIQPSISIAIANLGWRKVYTILGLTIGAIVVVFTLLFIKNSPEDKGLQPLGADEADGLTKKENQQEDLTGVPLKTAVKSKAFYMLLIFMIAITAFGAFSQHMATYGATLGYDPQVVGTVLSISMIGSTVGAIIIGIVSDKIGIYKTTLGIIGVVISSILCLALGGTSIAVFTLGAFLLGLGSMGIPVLAPLLAKAFFGKKDYEGIYANVMMGPPFATVVLLPLYGFIYDLTNSYIVVIGIISIIILIGTICIVFGWKLKDELIQEK